MQPELLTTTAVAALCRRDKTQIYEVFDTPPCQCWLPEKAPIGEPRRFNERQALLMMLLSDLSRWGLSIPFAGRVVTRIAETLCEYPDAEVFTISFRENGASFFIAADNRDADLASEDSRAGPVRFRVVFELSTYRDAISAALSEVEDVAA